MKKKLFSLMLLMFVCSMQTTVFAQNDSKARFERRVDRKERPRLTPEQMMQRQTRYVVKQLELDDAKQDNFIAIYKKYQNELRSCHESMRNKFEKKNIKNHEELTDAQITERIEARFAQSRKILDIREKYYQEFKQILTPRQIQKMYRAEKEIQKKVHKEIGRRMNNPRDARR